MASGKIYANTTAETLSSKLVGNDRLIRLADSKSGEAAVKTLGEFGFGDGQVITNPADYETLCKAEEAATYRFCGELCPSKKLEKAFKAQFDYLNLKAVLKAKYGSKVELDKMTYSFTDTAPEELKEKIFADDYKELSAFQRAFAEETDVLHVSGKLTPSKTDTLADKAMFEEIFSLLKGSGEKTLEEYYKTAVDLINIGTAARAVKNGDDEKSLEGMLIGGGEIDEKLFVDYLENGDARLKDAVKFTKYRRAVDVATEGSVTEYELLRDDVLTDVYKSKRTMPPEGLNQFFGYMFGRLTAVKNVRIVMVCLNNGIDKDRMRERLRKTYA